MILCRFPGRTGTAVNDRLRRETEINGDRERSPCTMSVYEADRQETDSVYDGREKIRSFGFTLEKHDRKRSYTVKNDSRIRRMTTIDVYD